MSRLSPTRTWNFCESHFLETHKRQSDGRYIFSLPLISDVEHLGNSKALALKRYMNLERRLSKDEELKRDYVKFMKEYEDLGHMSLVSPDSQSNNIQYFIPHHPVFKPTSSSTKTRVVFDASAKTTSGISLNDIMAVGPVIQRDLFSILVQFRTHKYAFTADIAKMYSWTQIIGICRKFCGGTTLHTKSVNLL